MNNTNSMVKNEKNEQENVKIIKKKTIKMN